MLAGWCVRESPVRKRKREVRDISQTTGQVDHVMIVFCWMERESERTMFIHAVYIY